MKKNSSKKIVSIFILTILAFQLSFAQTDTVPLKTKKPKSTIAVVKAKAEALIEKIKSMLREANILEKTGKFVEGKSKQNEAALEAAANGQMKVVGKRYVAKDPTAKKIQEQLDKAQAERLQKYDNLGGP